MELQPAYITIVEGPPPNFEAVSTRWSNSVLEGNTLNDVVMVDMRTFDGPKLVQRCKDAWAERRPARLNFPLGNGERGELDIIAAQWEQVEEGHKLHLWIRIDGEFEVGIEPDDYIDPDDFGEDFLNF